MDVVYGIETEQYNLQMARVVSFPRAYLSLAR